jgi:hypothetical protein
MLSLRIPIHSTKPSIHVQALTNIYTIFCGLQIISTKHSTFQWAINIIFKFLVATLKIKWNNRINFYDIFYLIRTIYCHFNMELIRYFFSYYVFEIYCMFHTYTASQFGPTTFQCSVASYREWLLYDPEQI